MKLSFSNIALDSFDHIDELYTLREIGYKGLEVAPSKVWENVNDNNIPISEYLLSIPIDNTIEEYTGITTKSLSTKILSLTEEDALINVVTQRVETQDDLSQEIYYQDIEIGLIKSGNKWLVSSAYWQ